MNETESEENNKPIELIETEKEILMNKNITIKENIKLDLVIEEPDNWEEVE